MQRTGSQPPNHGLQQLQQKIMCRQIVSLLVLQFSAHFRFMIDCDWLNLDNLFTSNFSPTSSVHSLSLFFIPTFTVFFDTPISLSNLSTRSAHGPRSSTESGWDSGRSQDLRGLGPLGPGNDPSWQLDDFPAQKVVFHSYIQLPSITKGYYYGI